MYARNLSVVSAAPKREQFMNFGSISREDVTGYHSRHGSDIAMQPANRPVLGDSPAFLRTLS